MKSKKEIELEILQHYFSFEGNVATLKLVYETFAELVNPNFGDDKIEKLNDNLFADIRDAVSILPKRYKLDLQIVIKDFGDYTKKECEEIIKQNVYLAGYRSLKENNKKRIGGWSLIGVGAAVLLVSYFLRNYDLWFDLINISGTLFVWEGVYTAFIERNQESRQTLALAKAIKSITITQASKEKSIANNKKYNKK